MMNSGMKKICSAAFFFFLFCCSTYAQNFGGGITAGLSLNQIDGDTYGGYSKPGVVAGFIVNRELGKKFTLAMELKFVQKGSRASYNIETESGEYYRVQLNYIQLPLLGQYNFWNHFWGEAGLAYGYLINFKEEDDFGELPDPVPFKKSELAVLLGVAYDIPKTKLRVNIRATNSILPIRQIKNQKNKDVYYVDANARGQYNRNLEFALAWFFK